MRKTIVILAALVIVTTAGCSKKEEAEVEAPPPVQVTAAKQDTVRRTITGDGVLWAYDQTPVTPKIQAPVQKFYVNRGDHVKQGQLLAVLENRDLIQAAAEARSALDQAESNLRTTQGATIPEALVKAQADVDAARQAVDAAKRILASRQELLRQGALARRLVDEAQLTSVQANSTYLAAQEHLKALRAVSNEEQVKTAAAQVAAARAHYQSLETQVGYSRITSPISGVVGDRPLFAGEVAQPGTPLLTVLDISRVVARINVPQNQAGAVRVGMPATVTLTGVASNELPGKVTVVSPASDPNTTTVQVWIELPNPGEKLKPGAGVHGVVIAEAVKAATIVPASAILPGEEGGTAILVVSSDSIAHKRQAVLGIRDGDKVQVLNGVKPGETVVVVGGMGVDDKTKVRIVNTTVEESDEEDESAPPAGKKDEPKAKEK